MSRPRCRASGENREWSREWSRRSRRARWTRTTVALACALVGALACAREARALEGEHCVTNHGDLAPCMSGGGQACCDAVRTWETNGCFCDGVSTSLDATQTAGAVSFASSCSIVRTTDASDSLCALAAANQQQGGSSPPSPSSSPSSGGGANSTSGPDAPTNVYAIRTGANEVVVGWTASASSDVVAYAIDGCDASNLATCASPTRTNVLSGTSHVFTGVTNPSTMVYRVKAATLTTASNSSSPTTVPMLDARDALLVSAASSASSATTCARAGDAVRLGVVRARRDVDLGNANRLTLTWHAHHVVWLDARFVRGRVHRLGDGRGEHRLGLRRDVSRIRNHRLRRRQHQRRHHQERSRLHRWWHQDDQRRIGDDSRRGCRPV